MAGINSSGFGMNGFMPEAFENPQGLVLRKCSYFVEGMNLLNINIINLNMHNKPALFIVQTAMGGAFLNQQPKKEKMY